MCATASEHQWSHAGELVDSAIIFEDDITCAFVRDDRTTGYSFVIPRRHVPTLAELTEPEAAALFRLVLRLARVIADELAPAGLNVVQNNGVIANQTVPHVHVHVAPRFEGEAASVAYPYLYDDAWSGTVASHSERADLASRLRRRLE